MGVRFARKTLLEIMHRLSFARTYKYSIVFKAIVRNLEWAEMGHIPMIYRYVYFENPDVLAFNELNQQERSVMINILLS